MDHRTDLEDSLNREMRRWLWRALGDVLTLPTTRMAHEHQREVILRALARTHVAFDAVRLFATECDEVGHEHLSSSTVRFAGLARELCISLEEEVNFVEAELLIYAC